MTLTFVRQASSNNLLFLRKLEQEFLTQFSKQMFSFSLDNIFANFREIIFFVSKIVSGSKDRGSLDQISLDRIS